MDLHQLKALFAPLHEEASTLAPQVFAQLSSSADPCAYLIRDAFHDPRGQRPLPAGWPQAWQKSWHLPEPFIGDPLRRPPIAFVGLNPSIDEREDCPRWGTSVDEWIEFWRNGFDSDGRLRVAIEPVRLYEQCYQPILKSALGSEARLGREAIVTEVIRYKSLSPIGNGGRAKQLLEAIRHNTSGPLTVRFLNAVGVRVIITVGREATQHVGGHYVPALRKVPVNTVHGKIFRFAGGCVVPSKHLTGAFGVTNDDRYAVGRALKEYLVSIVSADSIKR